MLKIANSKINEVAIVDELLTIDCGNTSRLSHAPPISSHQPHHANKQ